MWLVVSPPAFSLPTENSYRQQDYKVSLQWLELNQPVNLTQMARNMQFFKDEYFYIG